MNVTTPDWANPPLSTQKPAFKFPKFERRTLSNGAELLLCKDNTQPLVNLKILIDSGAAQDGIPGLASLTAQMLFRGTGRRSASEIAETTDMIAAQAYSAASWDSTSIGFSCMANFIEPAFDVIADCLYNPKFEESEIERLKKKTIADIRHDNADTNYLSGLAFGCSMYAGHPYGHARGGTEKSIDSITKNNCLGWYNNNLMNSRLSVIVSGDFDTAELIRMLESKLKPLGRQSLRKVPAQPEIAGNNVVIIAKEKAPQTTVRIGMPSIGRDNADYTALQLLSTIFGGYFMSRLNHLLRETKGYTYGAFSSVAARKYGSAFVISSNVGNEHVGDAIGDAISELEIFSGEKLESGEVERARQYLSGSFLRSVESPKQIATMLSSLLLYGLPDSYFDDFFGEISEVTSDELSEVQKKYMSPGGMVIVAAGDPDVMRPQLARFGDVKLCDNQGALGK